MPPPRSKKDLQDWKLRGLSKALESINIPSFDSENDEQVVDLLQDCRYIGSYNWLPGANKDDPAIIVPGSPNVWADPKLPLQVNPDKGNHYRDQNNHILPGQPLLPLVVAVHKQQLFSPDEWKTVDFVTDRNNLRKLLRWIQLAASKTEFRIDTQLVGEKTVVLNRCERTTTDFMRGSSYGFNFEKATTVPMSPATKRAEGHHRVVTYQFGRFKMMVQFELDGCLLQSQDDPSSHDDALIDAMAGLGFSNKGDSAPSPAESIFGLKVHPEGNPNVPTSSIIEMTTASKGRTLWNEKYPQLYFSQTENYFTGCHAKGQFHEIKKRTLHSPDLQHVAAKFKPAFKQLEEALGQIQSLVVQHGKQERLSLIYDKPNLAVHKKLNSSPCLPPEAIALFD